MASYDKPNRSKYFSGPIYDQMAEDLQLNGKAQRTVHGYLRNPMELNPVSTSVYWAPLSHVGPNGRGGDLYTTRNSIGPNVWPMQFFQL